MRLSRVRRLVALLGVGLLGLALGGTVGFVVQEDRPPDPTVDIAVPAPVLRPLTLDTMLAWTPGGLPDGLAEQVGRLPGVQRAVVVASGTAWLTASASSDGTPVDRPPAGLAFPLEVNAADLSAYAPFLSPGDRSLLPALGNGEGVLGETGARLRGLGPGATLSFGARRVRVAGVVPDGAIGAHEVFVSRTTGEMLGITRQRYLLIDRVDGASRAALEDGIRRLLPEGVQVQFRGPGETPFFRHGDAVLPPVRLKEVFGEFAGGPLATGYIDQDPAWTASRIARVEVPLLGVVRCHRALIPQLRGALAEIEREGMGRLIDPGDYGGCYASRFLNRIPAAGVSHHSWGVAIDVNVRTNGYGRTPHQDPRVVAIFRRWGFTWGGDWIIPDGMHFEFVAFPTGS